MIQVFTALKAIIGEALLKHVIVVLTGGGRVIKRPDDVTAPDFLDTMPHGFRTLLREAGDR